MVLVDQLPASMNYIAANEVKLAELYEVYAGLFAELAAFWKHLSAEEREHALWVHRLEDNLRSGAFPLTAHRIDVPAFREFHTYLEQRIQEAYATPPSLFAALTVARDIEKTLVERPFFEVFDSDALQVKRLLNALHESTERHYQSLLEVWEAHRPRRNP